MNDSDSLFPSDFPSADSITESNMFDAGTGGNSDNTIDQMSDRHGVLAVKNWKFS